MFNTLQTRFTVRGLCQFKKDQLVSFPAGFWMSHIVTSQKKTIDQSGFLETRTLQGKPLLYIGTLNNFNGTR